MPAVLPTPFWVSSDKLLRCWRGNCVKVLAQLPPASVDAVITDPPYPEISRRYGRLGEREWHALMAGVVAGVRRVLKPTGSAVFVLQANSERVGRMRPWLWEFQARVAREWNVVQDAYWWNPAGLPNVHCQRKHGLLRASVKSVVWCGAPDCYRNQGAVLWTQSAANAAVDRSNRCLQTFPSGYTVRSGRTAAAADERGGVTPFNLIPIPNTVSKALSKETRGHGAATPLALCSWWVRYLCPPGGTVLDPFLGTGTTLQAVRELSDRRRGWGIEVAPSYLTDFAIPRLSSSPPAPNALQFRPGRDAMGAAGSVELTSVIVKLSDK